MRVASSPVDQILGTCIDAPAEIQAACGGRFFHNSFDAQRLIDGGWLTPGVDENEFGGCTRSG